MRNGSGFIVDAGRPDSIFQVAERLVCSGGADVTFGVFFVRMRTFTTDVPVLDQDKLSRMRDYLDEQDYREVVGGLGAALAAQLQELDRSNRSAVELRGICHDVIGLSGTLGMMELMYASERVMELARADSSAEDTALAVISLSDAAVRALQALQISLK